MRRSEPNRDDPIEDPLWRITSTHGDAGEVLGRQGHEPTVPPVWCADPSRRAGLRARRRRRHDSAVRRDVPGRLARDGREADGRSDVVESWATIPIWRIASGIARWSKRAERSSAFTISMEISYL